MASDDAPAPTGEARPNPYEALAADPDPHEKPYEGTYENPYDPYGARGGTRAPGDGGGQGVTGETLGFTFRPEDLEGGDERPGAGGEYGRGEPDFDFGYEDRMPYIRAVRRRRKSRVRRTLKVVIALCTLLAFLVVGDRWAGLYAENKAAEKVQQSLKLHAEPEVHIRGFPFLSQFATDRLDQVDVAIPDMPAGRVSVAQVKGSIKDVRIVGDDTPTSIKGAVLGKMHGDVLLDFDDLDRELGTSQVKFRAGGGPNTVLADGELPIAGKKVKARARAHLQRTGDQAVGTTVDSMRLDVPGLFSYTPGKEGGLRLAKPLAQRVQKDASQAKALFGVRSIAKRFGLNDERAQQVRQSEEKLHEVTGSPKFVDRLMKVNMLDEVLKRPWLLKKVGIDPGLVDSVRQLKVPKLQDKLSLNTRLPEMPGHVKLRGISVEKDGIHAKLTGSGLKVGGK
ncbi:DUF2993 domain-containing protein [Streptomyces sp. ODS28]|uniref:LmeA family phospholipid-binding protein n=1 Tax=Streptomyces sp. ODS28 TaxID=3136688 RepID=UPI0031F1B1A9